MDHKVVPRTCKICDWLLNSSWDHFGSHQGKHVRVTMEFKVPKRHILKPIYLLTWSIGFLWRERQKRCFGRKRQGPMVKKCYYNEFLMNILWRREDEDKRRHENGWTWICFLKTTRFGHILKKSVHPFFGAWVLLVHIWFTSSEGPKGFVNFFFKKSGHGSWTIKSDHGKMPSSMVQLHGPWCKLALSEVGWCYICP